MKIFLNGYGKSTRAVREFISQQLELEKVKGLEIVGSSSQKDSKIIKGEYGKILIVDSGNRENFNRAVKFLKKIAPRFKQFSDYCQFTVDNPYTNRTLKSFKF